MEPFDDVAELNRLFGLPSPVRPTLADVTTNAVLIDASGIRAINLCKLVPVVRVPIPRRFSVEWPDQPPRYAPPEVREFRLSSIQDGIAVYQAIANQEDR
jgi:hypothetical protein